MGNPAGNKINPTGYRLDADDKRRLERLAERDNITKSEALRRAIRKASEE